MQQPSLVFLWFMAILLWVAVIQNVWNLLTFKDRINKLRELGMGAFAEAMERIGNPIGFPMVAASFLIALLYSVALYEVTR